MTVLDKERGCDEPCCPFYGVIVHAGAKYMERRIHHPGADYASIEQSERFEIFNRGQHVNTYCKVCAEIKLQRSPM